MANLVTSFPRSLTTVPSPLGLYLRTGKSDHRELTNVLLSGPQKFFGAVIDARHVKIQKDLCDQLRAAKLDLILDPKTQESAFEHAYRSSMASLPWGLDRPHKIEDFRELLGRQRIVKLAEFAINHGFTQVIAPSHYLSSVNDAWLGTDTEATKWLRAELDRRGGKNLPIIYSLAMSGVVFKDPEQRAALISTLTGLPIDSLWLRIDGFGADAGPIVLARTMDAMADFHKLGMPIIADQVGGVIGLALLAFGCVGGVSHGITTGEAFSTSSWRRPRSSNGGGGWRIYSPPRGMMLTKKEAQALLASSPRAKAAFGNRNTVACPRGVDDMLYHPVRAFVVQRADEVANLGAVPDSLRPQHFLEKTVRPLTDCALAATRISWSEGDLMGQKLKARLANHLKHVEDIRITLGGRAEHGKTHSAALAPATRIIREGKN